MGVSENTVLARARREKWTPQIAVAKQSAQPLHSNALTPAQSAALTIAQRGERWTERLASISERMLPHLESMDPGEILTYSRNLERFDNVARRNFGLDSQPPGGCPVNFAVLANRAAIQIISPESVGR